MYELLWKLGARLMKREWAWKHIRYDCDCAAESLWTPLFEWVSSYDGEESGRWIYFRSRLLWSEVC